MDGRMDGGAVEPTNPDQSLLVRRYACRNSRKRSTGDWATEGPAPRPLP